jgi:Mn2+/Fe2+ NRAMP family transporter
VLNLFSGMVNMAGVLILTAALLRYFIPDISMAVASITIMAVLLLITLPGRFRLLDSVSRIIMVTLTVATLVAVGIAFSKGPAAPAGFEGASPWQLSALAFLVPLIGWMPAPIEISAITSLWNISRNQGQNKTVALRDAIFDFNLGYLVTAFLALVFLALGALVQYGAATDLNMAGGAYIRQFVQMYASTIGEWSKLLVAGIAFLCMFGTSLTVLDGYSRSIAESVRVMRTNDSNTTHGQPSLIPWVLFLAASGLVVIFVFNSLLSPMLMFAMTLSFITMPVFSWLNFSLVRAPREGDHQALPGWLILLSWSGLLVQVAFTGLFIFWMFF